MDRPPGDEAKDKEQIALERDPEEPNVSPSETSEGRSGINIDPKVERRLLWKFDFYLLPMLAMMYLFRYVRRS